MSERSLFASALFNLMISPKIYTIQEWCTIVNPWVTRETPEAVTHTIDPTVTQHNPKTLELIESWFNDEALPTGNQLRDILDVCENGNKNIFGAWIHGEVNDEALGIFIEKFERGREQQEVALQRMYETLDKFTWDVTPLARTIEPIKVHLSNLKLGMFMFSGQIQTLVTLISAIPIRNRQSVFVKVATVLREAEKNNWYETPRNLSDQQ